MLLSESIKRFLVARILGKYVGVKSAKLSKGLGLMSTTTLGNVLRSQGNDQRSRKMEKCKWIYNEEDELDTEYWKTECGRLFVLMEGTPKENDMKFCCYCGKQIEEQIEEQKNVW